MVGGVVAAAIVIVVVLVIVSSGGGSKGKPINLGSRGAVQAANAVQTELRDIPQHGDTLGRADARVTMIEYGDLACPVCQGFALGGEQQLIANEVRQGKVKIEYRALETASGDKNGSGFVPGQMAALAAGEQGLGWNYIELFYHEQESEETHYVTTAFLQSIARQIKGLDYAKWNTDRTSSTLKSQVTQAEAAAASAGFTSTPTIVFQGPVSQAKPIAGEATYGELQSALKSVA